MNWQTIATISVGRILNWVLVGIAIALFAEILLRAAKKRNSGTRFAVWFSALLGIAVVPFAGYMVPEPSLAQGISHSRVLLPASWALYLLSAWAALVLIGFFRIGFGLWQVHRLRRGSIEIPLASLHPLLRSRLERHQGRYVLLYQSEDVRIPIAVGFLPAAIILPSWTLNELSPAELDAVLLHELAHIERWDDWTNLAQRIISAIFFFHPAVWWIETRLSLEREMACDDLVLNETSNPQDYADCLVSLAEKSFVRRGLGLAQAAVSRMKQTAKRIAQILDVNRPGAIAVSKPVLALVASFCLASLFVVNHTPQLVAFDGNSARAKGTIQIQAAPPRQVSSAPEVKILRDTKPAAVVAASSHSSRAATPKASIASESSLGSVAHNARWVQKSASSTAEHLVSARAKDRQPATTSADAYFLVVQAGYAPSGEAFWTIRVVQLTVFHPNSSRTQQELPPKSI
jgi:beta-lactamase regulating signal transducer with metallopeptidase domain